MSRKFKDNILRGLTVFASSISVIVLGLILGFVMVRGTRHLSIDMFTTNYWSENGLVSVAAKPTEPVTVEEEGIYYISDYGFYIKDSRSLENERKIEIFNVQDDLIAHSLATGQTVEPYQLPENIFIETVKIVTDDGNINGGTVYGDNAESLAEKFNTSSSSIEIYYKTMGGGISGSIKATFMLIGMSILIAFPIGVFAAIYFNEVAKDNIITRLFKQLIDLLAGVPSIVFGLMGMVVLYPIVSVFSQSGQSILLGALTMAVVLLPVIIKTTQEAFIAVPQELRHASLSLGASDTQTIFKVLLPSSIPGLLSSLILAISRIMGESAALIFTMGSFVNDNPTITNGGTTLAVHIWSLLSHENPNVELASSIAIVILVMVLFLNLSVHYIGSFFKLRKGNA